MEVPDYRLPEEAIAQRPIEPRDAARLLDASHRAGEVVHRHVRDLAELLGKGDLLVLNTTRVIPARLQLRKQTGGAAEVMLLEPDAAAGPDHWKALVRPGRRLAPGTLLESSRDGRVVVEIGERLEDGQRRVRLLADTDEVLAACGTLPLPPYIHEPLADPERYQTVYAERPGSVAAPTAGLHLTESLLECIEATGARVAAVDLAVGLATFHPITAATVEGHSMHVERYRIPAETADAIATARRVIAVGTTTVRALETASLTGALEGASDLYITPGFDFRTVDVLLTNFHLPRSSLLVLLEAFCGPRWRDLYAEALATGYRFLSFGDAMLVARAQ